MTADDVAAFEVGAVDVQDAASHYFDTASRVKPFTAANSNLNADAAAIIEAGFAAVNNAIAVFKNAKAAFTDAASASTDAAFASTDAAVSDALAMLDSS